MLKSSDFGSEAESDFIAEGKEGQNKHREALSSHGRIERCSTVGPRGEALRVKLCFSV